MATLGHTEGRDGPTPSAFDPCQGAHRVTAAERAVLLRCGMGMDVHGVKASRSALAPAKHLLATHTEL